MKIPIHERRSRGVCINGHDGYVLEESITYGWTATRLAYGPNVGWRLNKRGERKPYCLQCHREQVAARNKLSKEKRDDTRTDGRDTRTDQAD